MSDVGPVQLIAVEFGAEASVEATIGAALVALQGETTIRLLDLLFVSKDAATDELVALEGEADGLGAIAGALLGFEFEGIARYTRAERGRAAGLTTADVQELGTSLRPGRSAAFLLVEHIWARDLMGAIREAGGVPVGDGFLTAETVHAIEPELGGRTPTRLTYRTIARMRRRRRWLDQRPDAPVVSTPSRDTGSPPCV